MNETRVAADLSPKMLDSVFEVLLVTVIEIAINKLQTRDFLVALMKFRLLDQTERRERFEV